MDKPKRKPGRPPLPPELKKKKPKGKYVKGEPRPFLWKYPDPLDHEMHIPFLKARAQARFRKEPWDLTFDDWKTLWKGRWHLRGREPEDLCMTRDDRKGAWTLDNILVITRLEFLKTQKEPRGPSKTKRRSIVMTKEKK